MTFDDDMLRLNFDGGSKMISLAKLGLEWPPPETIDVLGFTMHRISYSAITDEQREGMTHVFRGAEYEPLKEAK